MKTVAIHKGVDVNFYTVSEIKAQGLNRWKGWSCEVGVRTLYIDFDGNMWRGPCRVGDKIGHMLSDWTPPEGDVVCTRDTCDCGTGIKLRKHADTHIGWVRPVYEQPVQIQWDLTRRCNFDCSYCWPTSHNKTDEYVPGEVLKLVVEKISKLSGSEKQFNFAGGEPTLHPDFEDLCVHIHTLVSFL